MIRAIEHTRVATPKTPATMPKNHEVSAELLDAFDVAEKWIRSLAHSRCERQSWICCPSHNSV